MSKETPLAALAPKFFLLTSPFIEPLICFTIRQEKIFPNLYPKLVELPIKPSQAHEN